MSLQVVSSNGAPKTSASYAVFTVSRKFSSGTNASSAVFTHTESDMWNLASSASGRLLQILPSTMLPSSADIPGYKTSPICCFVSPSAPVRAISRAIITESGHTIVFFAFSPVCICFLLSRSRFKENCV